MAEVEEEPEHPEPRLSAAVPLTAEHDLSIFDRGVPALSDWLRHRALKNESRFSRTCVVCEGDRVVAYFCISAGSVERATAPGRVRRNTSGRSRSRSSAGSRSPAATRAKGSAPTSFRTPSVASQSIGIGAVLVHAKDDAAKRFYMKCAEFIEYPDESRTLILRIETVVAVFR